MSTDFLSKYRDGETNKLRDFSATQFAEVWTHFDADGNGFIEGKELDSFLREFVTSVTHKAISDADLASMRQEFMTQFDENADNKIELRELARILPTDENFLLLFRRENPLESSAEFMQIWKQFDKDCSGYIEANELEDFLVHLIKDSKGHCDLSPEKLSEYTTTAMKLFDETGDGKLQLSEMARLIPVKENFLAKPIFKNADKISPDDVEKTFRHYDRDGNGTIEKEELCGFLKDLLATTSESYTTADLENFKRIILEQWDVDHDGKINKDELTMLLSQQRLLAEKQ